MISEQNPNTNTPSSFTDLNELLHTFTQALHSSLGATLHGIYLHGSLAYGDFDTFSDVDFIVVVQSELTPEEVTAVKTLHSNFFAQENQWAKRLNYSFFPLKNWQNAPANHALWFAKPGSDQLEKSSQDDSLAVRYTVREKEKTLFGPSPKSVLAPISNPALRDEMYQTLITWGEEIQADPVPYKNRFYQSHLVLHFCRMICDLKTGEPGSKWMGIDWAKDNLDRMWTRLIDFAWLERQEHTLSVEQPSDPQAFPLALLFMEYILEECERYRFHPATL